MNTVDFPETNLDIAKDQPQYQPIRAFRDPSEPQGRLVFCWELSAEERAEVARTGRVWHQVLTFNWPLQPQMLSVEKPEMAPPREPTHE